jgi:adenylylsulfate kinase-like enzyme
LYGAAHAGQLPQLTGVGATYEEPEAPDVRLMGEGDVLASVQALMQFAEA